MSLSCSIWSSIFRTGYYGFVGFSVEMLGFIRIFGYIAFSFCEVFASCLLPGLKIEGPLLSFFLLERSVWELLL